MNLKISSALAAVAMAFTLTHANHALAYDNAASAEAAQFDPQTFETSEIPSSEMSLTDDLYADLSLSARGPGGPGGGHGPGRPGGGGHPGGPGWGPGWGPGPGHGPGGPGGPGWGRGIECRAVNARGFAFYGVGRDMRDAQNDALDRCYRSSRRCWIDRCDRR